MKVHPAIATLRGAPVSQRRPSLTGQSTAPSENAAAIKAAREAWLARPVPLAVAEGLKRYGEGQCLAGCKALHTLLHDHRAANAFLGSLFERVLPVLRERPMAEAPFHFKVSQGLSTIRLMEGRGATLSLVAYEPLTSVDAPQTALFSDREVHELVLAGSALGVSHNWQGEGQLGSTQHRWSHGDTITLHPRSETRQILKVERTLLLLQLTREPVCPAPTRLVALQTGRTIRTASGDKSASQAVMALGVLGALKDHSALDVMERTALHPFEDHDVRWEAVRQTLALDAARGLELLRKLEARIDDPLANPARALMAQLLEAQPELRRFMTQITA